MCEVCYVEVTSLLRHRLLNDVLDLLRECYATILATNKKYPISKFLNDCNE
jgi:hypothetical protein